jgi:hypothetical protein
MSPFVFCILIFSKNHLGYFILQFQRTSKKVIVKYATCFEQHIKKPLRSSLEYHIPVTLQVLFTIADFYSSHQLCTSNYTDQRLSRICLFRDLNSVLHTKNHTRAISVDSTNRAKYSSPLLKQFIH